jgi:type IV secretion system protein TrbL
MGVCDAPVVSWFCQSATSLAATAATDVLGQLAKDFAQAQAELVKVLVAGWTQVPTPTPNGTSGTVAFLQSSLSALVTAVATIALIAAAGRLIWECRSQPAKEALAGVLRLVVVVGAGVAVLDLLVQIGDGFSNWILSQAAGVTDPAAALATVGGAGVQTFASPALLLIVSAVAIVAFLIQIGLLLVRSALMVVLAGVWPLTAAASMTPAGNAWWKKTTGWLLAAVLFKPAASVVYAAAIRLFVNPTSGLDALFGIVMLVLAVFTLPALMKFVVPMVAAAGGLAVAEVGAGAAAVATGAVMLAGTAGAGAAGGAQASGAVHAGPPSTTGPPGGATAPGGGDGPPGGLGPPGANGSNGSGTPEPAGVAAAAGQSSSSTGQGVPVPSAEPASAAPSASNGVAPAESPQTASAAGPGAISGAASAGGESPAPAASATAAGAMRASAAANGARTAAGSVSATATKVDEIAGGSETA